MVIRISSVKDAVNQGTLIELSRDYRTATAVRAILPKDLPCAMSMTAFRQHVHQQTADGRRTGVQALCAFLSEAFGLRGAPAGAESPISLPPPGAQPSNGQFKLIWYAPSRCWVVLLPHEEIQPAAAGGHPPDA